MWEALSRELIYITQASSQAELLVSRHYFGVGSHASHVHPLEQ